jgi:hypothetical protein
VCQSGSKGCSATEAGLVFCRGVSDATVGQKVGGHVCVKAEAGAEFRAFKRDDGPDDRDRPHRPGPHANGNGNGHSAPLIDWADRHGKARGRLTPDRLAALARALGLPERALAPLEPGYEHQWPRLPHGVYTFPMRDAVGDLCGLHGRCARTGKKEAAAGARLGVIAPARWQQTEGTVYVPEGASDVAALTAMGLTAVGRPSARAGLQQLADLLAGCRRDIVVLGEMDPKGDGDWPGRDGAVATAKRLAAARREAVAWSFPPDGAKDVRAWFKAQGLNEVSLLDEAHEAGARFEAGLCRNTVKPAEGGEDDPELIQGIDDIPTLADAHAAGASKRWLWEGWLQADVVNGLVSKFGDGKTRLLAELIRRIRAGESWPDGQPMTLPADSNFLFVPLDWQHGELIDLAEKYEFPEAAVFINAAKDNPDGVSYIDTPEGVQALERRVEVLRPAFVVIDPMTAATTDKNLGRAEDATAIFGPLMRLARKHGIAVIASMHTNAQGGTYGRHGSGKWRVEVKLTKVQVDGLEERFRLEVTKSNSKFPAALGASQNDGGWVFDRDPPQAEAEGGRGRPGPRPTADAHVVRFLKEKLADGEQLQVEVIDAWVTGGHSKKSIFATAKLLVASGQLLAGERLSPRGARMLKTWALPPPPGG